MLTFRRTAILASLATAAILTAPMTTRAGDLIEPVLVGTLETDFARIRVFGDTVLLAGGTSVRFVDVSDPTDPQIIGSVSPSVGTVNSAWLEDNTLYISMGQNGAEIVDVSDLQNPQIISTIPPVEYHKQGWSLLLNSSGLSYGNGLLILGAATNTNCVLVYDVSDPESPTLLYAPQQIPYSFYATQHLEFRGGAVYVDSKYMTTRAINIADPENPHMIWSATEPITDTGMLVTQQRIFSYSYDSEFPHYSPTMSISDITDPLNPVGFSLPQGAYQRYGSEMAIAGNTLIKFPDKRTDISDVENPVYLPDFESELGYWGVVDGDYLYTMTQDDEFRIYSGFGTPSCPGDVTGDGETDLADLNLVLANFGQTTSDGDTNNDGVVDLADLNAVLADFGTNCN